MAYANAFSATGTGLASINVSNSGKIITHGSSADAIHATCVTDPSTCTITITNSGSGLIAAYGPPYHAIWAHATGSASSVSITNSGKIQGNVQLSSGVDTFVNSGTWVMQGNSSFGSGTGDLLNNTSTGLIKMLDSYPPSSSNGGAVYGSTRHWGDAYIAGAHYSGVGTYYQNGPVLLGGHHHNDLFHTVFLNGLDNFTNAGTISLKDGYANQQVVVSGNFIGAGGHLYVDAFLGKPGSRADLLTVGGTVSGTTHVVVNDTNPGIGAYNPVGIPVVIVGTGDSPVNAFDLAQGPIIKGLFAYDLYLNQNKNVWVLASTPGPTANELPRVITAVQDVWHQSAGVWLDRTADLRAYLGAPQPACDPRMYTKAPCLAPAPSSIGPGVWARAFGDWSHNGGTADETLYGKTHSYDVSYHQDIYGVQAGFDFAAQRTGYENLVFGFMAGALELKVNFASGTSVKLSGGNVGAYATLINRGLFADALLMANFLNVNYNHSVLLSDAGASAVSLGGHFDMGYRFNLKDGWFAEPLATIDAVWTHFNNFDLPNAGVGIDLNTTNIDLRGRLGGRVGKSFIDNGYRWEPSVTAGVWHSFSGENAATLTSGMYTLDVIDANAHSTYGEVGAALNVIDLATRWSAFVKGDYRFANDYYGGSVKGGVRFQW